MRLKLALAALLVLGLAVSQTSTEPAYVLVPVARGYKLVRITGLVSNADGSYSVPQQAAPETFTNGTGITFERVNGQPTKISVETTSFWMTVYPTAPLTGACRASSPQSDQRYMAVDAKHLYVCAPDGSGGYAWRTVPFLAE
ncbi:MAG: hypothetical protein ABFD89_18130 [Bryobacteraceae bacterium]